jgi:hypothetical protein
MANRFRPGRTGRVLPILLMAHGRSHEGIEVMPRNRLGASPGRCPMKRSRPLTWLRRAGAISALAILVTLVLAPPASADGEGETTEGYLLVQQALGHLAHDTSHEGMALALEKIEDALATEDQEGVDVAAVEQAKTALEAEKIDTARTLLQASIKEALSKLPQATGEETGTTVIEPALDTGDGMSGSDWWFIGVSLLALVAGVLLAFFFRPADTVGELRRRMEGGQ